MTRWSNIKESALCNRGSTTPRSPTGTGQTTSGINRKASILDLSDDDNSQSSTSDTSISLNSISSHQGSSTTFASCTGSPTTMSPQNSPSLFFKPAIPTHSSSSLPNLEGSSSSDLSAAGLDASLVSLQSQIVTPDDKTKQQQQQPPSSMDANISPEEFRTAATELANDILWIPPLMGLLAPEENRKISAKIWGKRNRSDAACRLPARTRTQKKMAAVTPEPKQDMAPSLRKRTIDLEDDDDDEPKVKGGCWPQMAGRGAGGEPKTPTSLRKVVSPPSSPSIIRNERQQQPKSESFLMKEEEEKRNNNSFHATSIGNRRHSSRSRRRQSSSRTEKHQQPKRRNSQREQVAKEPRIEGGCWPKVAGRSNATAGECKPPSSLRKVAPSSPPARTATATLQQPKSESFLLMKEEEEKTNENKNNSMHETRRGRSRSHRRQPSRELRRHNSSKRDGADEEEPKFEGGCWPRVSHAAEEALRQPESSSKAPMSLRQLKPSSARYSRQQPKSEGCLMDKTNSSFHHEKKKDRKDRRTSSQDRPIKQGTKKSDSNRNEQEPTDDDGIELVMPEVSYGNPEKPRRASDSKAPSSMRHMSSSTAPVQPVRYAFQQPKSESFLMEKRNNSLREKRTSLHRRSSRHQPTTGEPLKSQNSGSLRGLVNGRSSSKKALRTNSSSMRDSLRRSGLGSFLHKRRSSNSNHGVRTGVARTTSNHRPGGSNHRRSSKNAKEMNIFCSELVGTDYILAQIQEAKENPEIVRLELEDLLERCTGELSTAIKDLLEHDDRPWEQVSFVNEVRMDEHSSYRPWLQRKNHFFRHLGTVCTRKLIPMTCSTKLIIEDASVYAADDDKDDDEDDSIVSVPDDDECLVQLLCDVQKDTSVTRLTLSSSHSTPALVDALANLFQCDDRKWESVQLKLSGQAPFPIQSPEHDAWCEIMKTRGQEMKRVARERGIDLGE
ncbi:expressed unknown protein [Seminavis robusta]|uniref:Uncharacterized protein n=1 Tax=Seminavis robusta TaxID=568900 RepID=A0A9N8DVU6_9STRA|nr:expressed unknown protein [Seminavis robusta]|eukprot:Sro313_g114920.1 n/a (951) ;mRNA; r:57487-60339